MSKKNTEDKERLNQARGDFKRMKEEIAPFVKERDRRQHSTAGQWRTTRATPAERLNHRSQAGY